MRSFLDPPGETVSVYLFFLRLVDHVVLLGYMIGESGLVIDCAMATVINRVRTSHQMDQGILKEGQQAMNSDQSSYQLSHAYDHFRDTKAARRVKIQKK